MSKIFNFTVPVSGYEHFSVEADTYEEAVEKIYKEDYSVSPTLDDIDWDFGFREVGEELMKCYTVKEKKIEH